MAVTDIECLLAAAACCGDAHGDVVLWLWLQGRNYMGFIAQGPEEDAPCEPGVKEFDVAIVFRGTVFTDEWKSVREQQPW